MRAGAELICNAWYYSIYHIVAGIYGWIGCVWSVQTTSEESDKVNDTS